MLGTRNMGGFDLSMSHYMNNIEIYKLEAKVTKETRAMMINLFTFSMTNKKEEPGVQQNFILKHRHTH